MRDGTPPPPPPPPPHVQEDTYFAGNLGYGAEGDMCLYVNFDRLAEPCQSSVADLYDLREQYWEEQQIEQGPHHPHGAMVLLLLAVVFLFACARRYLGRQRRQQLRSLLTALHTNPDVKAMVEAQTGVQVPMPVAKGACGGACPFKRTAVVGAATGVAGQQQQAPQCRFKGVACRFVKALLFFSFVFATSLLISITSLELTMRIVGHMDEHAPVDPVTGEPAFTSPFAALLLLLAISMAELAVLALAVRAVKSLFVHLHGKQHCSNNSNQSGNDSAVCAVHNSTNCHCVTSGSNGGSVVPSAPMYEVSQHGNINNNTTLSAAQYYLTALPATLFGRGSSSNTTASSAMYAPLLTQESSEDTEMVSMASAARPATMVQQQQQRYAVMVPIAASPVNTVSMV